MVCILKSKIRIFLSLMLYMFIFFIILIYKKKLFFYDSYSKLFVKKLKVCWYFILFLIRCIF